MHIHSTENASYVAYPNNMESRQLLQTLCVYILLLNDPRKRYNRYEIILLLRCILIYLENIFVLGIMTNYINSIINVNNKSILKKSN